MRDIIIQKQDGTAYKLSDYYVKIIDVIVPSVDDVLTSDYVEGGKGIIPLGTRTDRAPIKVYFDFRAIDRDHFFSLRNDIFKILRGKEWFYLIDNVEPHRRWKVVCRSFEPQRIWSIGRQTVEFPLISPYAESTNDTSVPIEWGQGWYWGQGLEWGSDSYTYTTSDFIIKNYGDEEVDPRFMDLKITFKGASNNLRIRNLTTGDDWQYSGTTTANDTIIIDGIRSTKNSLSIVRETNRKLISLAIGDNNMRITGTSGPFTISVEFRFPYV